MLISGNENIHENYGMNLRSDQKRNKFKDGTLDQNEFKVKSLVESI